MPAWVVTALPQLPAAMAEGTRRAGRVERASVDLVEAALLARQVGERFEAVVVSVDDHHDSSEIALADLAVVARCSGRLPLGHRTHVVLDVADPVTRTVRFRPADDGAPGAGPSRRARGADA